MNAKKYIILSLGLLMGLFVSAQDQLFKAPGAPLDPKVNVRWNRFYDHAEITEICKAIAEAHPGLVSLESIGESYEERSLWCLTITDKATGEADTKPAYYIDGNIHSNEIQGSEIALYTAWYLTENQASVTWIRDLLANRTFYIVPTINPDARDHYMHEANNANSPRGGMVPADNDGDGRYDEDGYDDLDKNGHITMMRRESPNGRWKVDPDDPRRMIRCRPDEPGTHEMLGYEGIDNDGDGRINEDGVAFSYDPNRDWGWNWQPNYVQRGAYKYPFSLPETRAVADFVVAHPNIAGAQTYHNSGGMILRGPGAKEDIGLYNRSDLQVYDQIAKRGEEMLPGYDYLTIYKDLYSVYGGELDWFYGSLGIFTYSNELWTSYLMFNKDYDGKFAEAGKDRYKFDKYLLFEESFVPWQSYQHPSYGRIEIGGFKKSTGRLEPTFMLENDAHRNMAFTLYHADQMPLLEVQDIEVVELDKKLKQVTAVIVNKRLIPTHSAHDVKNHITRPDHISLLTPEDTDLIAGMVVQNADLGLAIEQKHQPARLKVDNIPGMGTVTVRWIVEGEGPFVIEVNSVKGGTASRSTSDDGD
ncbi:MAG: M14 family metallopeptidase [Bacteroidota bacterium]